MVKRKTVFQQMFLVDSVLYNKLNHINNNTNNVFFKHNPLHNSPPSQAPTQPPSQPQSLQGNILTPDLPKSEFARSLMDTPSDTFSQTLGVENRSTMTEMPRRAVAGTQTMSPINPMTDVVERFTRVAGPPFGSAAGSPSPLDIAPPPPVLQDEECMECGDENPIPAIANRPLHTKQITNEHNQQQTVASPHPVQSLQNIHRSSYRYRPNARGQLQFENNVRAIAPTEQDVSTLQNMIESDPYTQNMLELENNETAIALPLQPQNVIANNVRHSNQYQSYFNDRVLVKYSCLLCNTDFSTQKALKRHMKNIHDAYQQKEKGKKRQQTFTCDFCNSDFKSERALDRHIANVHDAAFQEIRGEKRPGNGRKPPLKYVKFF